MTLAPGLTLTRPLTVDPGRTIDFMGPDLRVYATPSMINDMEHACRDLAVAHLAADQDTVGVRVEVDHLDAVGAGVVVSVSAKIIAIDRRALTFEVAVRAGERLLGAGCHVRMIIDKARFQASLAAKMAGTL